MWHGPRRTTTQWHTWFPLHKHTSRQAKPHVCRRHLVTDHRLLNGHARVVAVRPAAFVLRLCSVWRTRWLSSLPAQTRRECGRHDRINCPFWLHTAARPLHAALTAATQAASCQDVNTAQCAALGVVPSVASPAVQPPSPSPSPHKGGADDAALPQVAHHGVQASVSRLHGPLWVSV